jgi:hypothetical protein
LRPTAAWFVVLQVVEFDPVFGFLHAPAFGVADLVLVTPHG